MLTRPTNTLLIDGTSQVFRIVEPGTLSVGPPPPIPPRPTRVASEDDRRAVLMRLRAGLWALLLDRLAL